MKSLSELIPLAKQKSQKKVAVISAHDQPVLVAIKHAIELNLVTPVLIGNKSKVESLAHEINLNLGGIPVINEPDDHEAAKKAVALVKNGDAHLLMKGLINTSTFLKAIINKETGLKLTRMLSHFALMESKHYHKLIALTDVAMNIKPTFDEKVKIIQNAVQVFHNLGVENPKVAVISPVETVNEKIESTVHAAMLTLMNKRKQITGCSIDGPLALDNAISKEAAIHKGIESEISGDVDILMVPDLDSGNILYKSMIYLGGALTAAIITGADVPIVLTSRSDSDESKLMSIALAAALD